MRLSHTHVSMYVCVHASTCVCGCVGGWVGGWVVVGPQAYTVYGTLEEYCSQLSSQMRMRR